MLLSNLANFTPGTRRALRLDGLLHPGLGSSESMGGVSWEGTQSRPRVRVRKPGGCENEGSDYGKVLGWKTLEGPATCCPIPHSGRMDLTRLLLSAFRTIVGRKSGGVNYLQEMPQLRGPFPTVAALLWAGVSKDLSCVYIHAQPHCPDSRQFCWASQMQGMVEDSITTHLPSPTSAHFSLP